MGYTTYFEGEFAVSPPLRPAHAIYLRHFAGTRRMQRDADVAATLPDPARKAAGLPIGPEGAYFVGGTGDAGQGHDPSVRNHNNPPEGQPSLWCQWVPSETGTAITWDGAEKFYDYVDWIGYLIEHFLTPWGYRLHGAVRFQGEDEDDAGVIYVAGDRIESCLDGSSSPSAPPAWYVENGLDHASRGAPDPLPDRADLLVALDEIEAAGIVTSRDVAALRRLVERDVKPVPRKPGAGKKDVTIRRRLRAAVDEWTTYEVDDDVDPAAFAANPDDHAYDRLRFETSIDEILDEVEVYLVTPQGDQPVTTADTEADVVS